MRVLFRVFLISLIAAGCWAQVPKPVFGGASSGGSGSSSNVINIKNPPYNAPCDGAHPTQDTAAYIAAMAAAKAAGGVPVLIPIGTCNIDNSAGVVSVSGYNGQLLGQGPGSQLVCGTITVNCLQFTGSNNLTIRDISLSYSGTVSSRGALQGILNVYSSSNVDIENVYLSNGPDSGITLSQLQHTKVDGVWCGTTPTGSVLHLWANCVFGVNLVDASINAVHSLASGDYPVETSYYSGNTLNACNQITVSNLVSHNDVGGFLNNGCQDVAFVNSTIDSTSSHPIVIRQDIATQSTQQMYPLNTTIDNIIITNAGSGPTVSGVTNSAASGIYFTVSTSTSTKIPVTISNVQIKGTQAYGIQMTDTGFHEWDGDFSNIVINGTGAGTSGAGGVLVNGDRVNGKGITVKNAGGSSLTFQDQVNGNWTGFESDNPNVGFGGSDDSIYNSSTGTIIMNGILLYDSGVSPVSRINNAASTGSAQYLGITPVMPNGTWQGFSNSNSGGAFCYTSLSVAAQTNCSVPGGGVSITSPNSSITVGGTSSNPTVQTSTSYLNLLYPQLSASNTFSAGQTQIFQPSSANPGMQIVCGSIPTGIIAFGGGLFCTSGGLVGYSDGTNINYFYGQAGSTTTPPTDIAAGTILASVGGGNFKVQAASISAPPYLVSGSNKYLTTDSMYAATTPSLGSWTAMSTQTGTVTAQANGSANYTNASSTNAFLAAPTQVTSIEVVFSSMSIVSTTAANSASGIFFYDSTNHQVLAWSLTNYFFSNNSEQLGGFTYSFSGSGDPSYSSSQAYFTTLRSPTHIKGSVSGGTLTYSYSLDGGASYIPGLTYSVGTIAKIGIQVSGTMNLLSVVVN